jgi:hypothetical protein
VSNSSVRSEGRRFTRRMREWRSYARRTDAAGKKKPGQAFA